MKNITIAFLSVLFVMGCKNKETVYDASGTFEAVETIISAEASGQIKMLNIDEGKMVTEGEQIGYIDSLPLFLKKKQLLAQINTVLSKRPNIATQIAALEEQLKQAQREQLRIANLVKADAVPKKQLDDANAQIAILRKQIEAQQSTLGIVSSGLSEETIPLEVQIEQVNEQLSKCKLTNPVNGTVLTKYANVNEFTSVGKPLYKLADLTYLNLRAYFTGDQFAGIKLNQKVKVFIDDDSGKTKELEGIIEWINSKAEFTPKTIQTKNERANLVYASKIKVKNDGTLKIGMYGEVKVN